MKFIFIVLFFSGFVHASVPPNVVEQDLQQRFSQPVMNDGPNCFNAAFMALGYVKDVIHTSTYEAVFYLKNFCQEVATVAPKAKNGALIVYVGADSVMYHMAVALGNGRVFEKYNYGGYHRTSRKDASRPGEYFIQDFQSSYYFQRYSSKTTKVFHCVEAEVAREKLAPLQQLGSVQSLRLITEHLAADVLRVEPSRIDEFFAGQALSYLEEVKIILKVPPKSLLEQVYVTALVSSIRDQLYFMAESPPKSCGNCTKRLLWPVHENISQINHLLAKNYSQQF